MWSLYEFLDTRGRGIIGVWLEETQIQKKARILLQQKLDMLEIAGPNLPAGLLAGPFDRHLYKLRINAQGVQLRPILCRGPIDPDAEFTLLLGARERGDRWNPRDAPQRATTNRQIILDHPDRRRPHEHSC